LPHSHAGSSIAEPHGHAARPHVHLHNAHRHDGHHHNHDKSLSSTDEQVPDHDSDAVYSGNDQLLLNGKVARIAKAELTALYAISHETAATSSLCWRCSPHDSPPVLRSDCALYLQLLSIRC